MHIFEIQENEAGQRFDKYLKKRLNKAPSSFLYKMLRKKNIVLNGKRADGSEKLNLGDQIKMFLSDDTILKFSGADFSDTGMETDLTEKYPYKELSILYETEDILVINKPSGMLSQKAEPQDASANEYMIRYLLDTHKITGKELNTFRPSICNRLDRNTSGILIAGKSLRGLQEMSMQLRERTVEKHYLCLVAGTVKSARSIQGRLTKDTSLNQVFIHDKEEKKGSFIETKYCPGEWYDGEGGLEYTLLKVHLITGRTHQIRAHLGASGHPIIGDMKYGSRQENRRFAESCNLHRQLLHAHRLVLKDGTVITAPLDDDFNRVLNYLKKR